MNHRRAFLILLAVAAALVAADARNVHAEPILGINAHLVDTSFTPTGGTFGLGQLVAVETVPLTLVGPGGQNTMTVDFTLIGSLRFDLSSGGLCDGLFENGTLVIAPLMPMNKGDTYLTADILSLRLEEVFDDRGLLAGSGIFNVTGGAWAADFAAVGRISQITFRITPQDLDSFSISFAGTSDITLTPIPEPATWLLLGTGVLGVIGYARRRRMV